MLLIINGPNLNLLGTREPDIYGHTTMDEYLEALRLDYPDVPIEYFQTNHEGDIIDRLHQTLDEPDCRGVILNAGGYTHTSVAIADAIRAITAPVVEVHITNIQARESIRHTSLITPACRGIIAGFGMDSYRLAIESLL